MHRCALTNAELQAHIQNLLRLSTFDDLGPRFSATQRNAAAALQELLDYRAADPTHVFSTVHVTTYPGESE